jgi:2,4-dienoyl-CoA reductase-like NADH-dependent reductase (Old Yellow Enzyme family)
MCQYSYSDGLSNDWQFVHLGSRAVGGAGIVFTEAAAVSPKAASRLEISDFGPTLTRLLWLGSPPS